VFRVETIGREGGRMAEAGRSVRVIADSCRRVVVSKHYAVVADVRDLSLG